MRNAKREKINPSTSGERGPTARILRVDANLRLSVAEAGGAGTRAQAAPSPVRGGWRARYVAEACSHGLSNGIGAAHESQESRV